MTALKGAVEFFPEIGGTLHTKDDISARHLIGSDKICRRIPPAWAQASATLPQRDHLALESSNSGNQDPNAQVDLRPEEPRGYHCLEAQAGRRADAWIALRGPWSPSSPRSRMGSSLAVRLHVKELSGRTCIDTRPCLMPCVSPEQTEYKMNTTSCGATKLRMSVPAWRSSTPIRRRSSARWSAMISSAICDGRR